MMFTLLAIAASLFVLVTLMGLPYPRTWYHRWDSR